MTASGSAHGVRKDIQALRAVAVTAVVAYHLWPLRVHGGLFGVDVFFVISGFLIGGGLAAAAATGQLSLISFWARRARRLLPAALTTIVATSLAVLAFVPARLWPTFMKDGIGAIGYVENLWLAHQSVNYVGSTAEPSPFQHFWSLGVEEQFYVAWPLLAVGAWAIGTRVWRRFGGLNATLAVAVACTVTSFIYAAKSARGDSPQPFFDPRARAWELGIGVVLALLLARRDPRTVTGSPGALVRAVMAIGWALVFGSVFMRPTSGHPGLPTLVPTLGAAAILAAGHCSLPQRVQAVVGLRAVQWVGDASYSIYLWHWPLIIVLPYAVTLSPRVADAVVIVGTLGLAAVSARWIERPFRFGLHRFISRPRWVIASVLPAMVLATAVPLFAVVSVERDAARDHELVQALLDGTTGPQPTPSEVPTSTAPSVGTATIPCFGAVAAAWPSDCEPVGLEGFLPTTSTALLDYGPLASVSGCHVEDWYSSTFAPCTYVGGDGSGARVAVVGDSHAQQYLPAIGALADRRNWTVEYTTKGHCPWSTALVDQHDGAAQSACSAWVGSLRQWLVAGHFDLIVTSQKRGESFIASDGLTTLDTSIAGLNEVWQEAADTGAKILVIEDNPPSVDDPQACLEAHPTSIVSDCSIAEESLGVDPQIAAVAALNSPHVALVSFTDAYCSAGRCLPIIGHVNVYRNHDHVTGTWATTLTQLLVDRAPAGFVPGSG